MKRNLMFITILCTMIFCSACHVNYNKEGVSDSILPPDNQRIDILGNWAVVSQYDQNTHTEVGLVAGNWEGQVLNISKNQVIIGQYTIDNPSYKVKTVNAEDYFLNTIGYLPTKLHLSQNEISVYSIFSFEGASYDFILTQKDTALTVIDKELLVLNRNIEPLLETEDIPQYIISDQPAPTENINRGEYMRIKADSGLLLGLRSPVITTTDDGELNTQCSYRTLWIPSQDQQIGTLYETSDIILPRRYEFWKATIRRISDEKGFEDIPVITRLNDQSMDKMLLSSIDPHFGENRTGSVLREITYIGNDHISMEVSAKGTYSDKFNEWYENRLITLPIDRVSNLKGYSIAEVAGSVGKDALERERANALNSAGIAYFDNSSAQENFGLIRKMGHWMYQGKDTIEIAGSPKSIDYLISVLPDNRIVAYDTLWVTWKSVKDKIPDVTDILTSPNMDIAVVIVPERLLIYAFEKGKLGDRPLCQIQLRKDETVVMSEWATGKYVKKWDDVFMSNVVNMVNVK